MKESVNRPLQRTADLDGASGTGYVALVCVFHCSIIICRLYKLTLYEKAKVTLQPRVSLSDLVYIFLGGLPLFGGGEQNFSSGPEAALGGPDHF